MRYGESDPLGGFFVELSSFFVPEAAISSVSCASAGFSAEGRVLQQRMRTAVQKNMPRYYRGRKNKKSTQRAGDIILEAGAKKKKRNRPGRRQGTFSAHLPRASLIKGGMFFSSNVEASLGESGVCVLLHRRCVPVVLARLKVSAPRTLT